MSTGWVAAQGKTYQPELDFSRLSSLFIRVKRLMLDGQHRTLKEISEATGGSEASVSARLRDLRKPENGSYTVLRKRRGDPKVGLFEYWIPL